MSRTVANLRAIQSASNRADIIRGAFAAYKSRNRKLLEDLFTSDFRFTSPYDDEIDKAAYFKRCWPASERLQGQTIEKIFIEGDEAFVQYRTRMDGKEFRNTEFWNFVGDRVNHVTVYFGAAYKDGSFVKQPSVEK